MVLNRETGSIENRGFVQIADFLRPGDVMVFNDSRVIPARLKGRRAGSGGKVEILLLRRREPDVWEALARPARRLPTGAVVEITTDAGDGATITGEIINTGENGLRVIRFPDESGLMG